MVLLIFLVLFYLLVTMTGATSQNTIQKEEEINNEDDPLVGVKGLKAKFGDKLVDLSDVRLHKPHSVIPNKHPGLGQNTHETTNDIDRTAGGLLMTGGHRPRVDNTKTN